MAFVVCFYPFRHSLNFPLFTSIRFSLYFLYSRRNLHATGILRVVEGNKSFFFEIDSTYPSHISNCTIIFLVASSSKRSEYLRSTFKLLFRQLFGYGCMCLRSCVLQYLADYSPGNAICTGSPFGWSSSSIYLFCSWLLDNICFHVFFLSRFRLLCQLFMTTSK